MKTTILLLSLISVTFANEIDISFGCYDCKHETKKNYQEKPEQIKKNNLFDKIQINGSITIKQEINK